MVANIGEDFVRVNMKIWLNLREVKAFELVGDDDRARMAERYAGANVDNFIWTVRKVDDSSFSLTRQKADEEPMAYLRRLARRPGLVAQQAIDAFFAIALLPAPDRRPADAGAPRDLENRKGLRRKENDARALHMLQRAAAVGD